MKLAISNIAWENSELDNHLKLIKELGCHGVEIAPSCIWPEPETTSKETRAAFKKKVNDLGLEVVGLHALLYTRPDLEIFGTAEKSEETAEYLEKLFELCQDLGGKTLIYGSPRSRRLQGRDYSEAFDMAESFFRGVAQRAEKYNVVLCIEPLSEKETDFIKSSEEGASLVERVDHPNFRLHLDAKAMVDSKEDFDEIIPKYAHLLRHYHVNDSELTPPGSTGFLQPGQDLDRPGA